MIITGRKRSKCVERWTVIMRCVLDPKQLHVGLRCIKWHRNSFPAAYSGFLLLASFLQYLYIYFIHLSRTLCELITLQLQQIIRMSAKDRHHFRHVGSGSK